MFYKDNTRKLYIDYKMSSPPPSPLPSPLFLFLSLSRCLSRCLTLPPSFLNMGN